jgi:hypothetical protein
MPTDAPSAGGAAAADARVTRKDLVRENPYSHITLPNVQLEMVLEPKTALRKRDDETEGQNRRGPVASG